MILRYVKSKVNTLAALLVFVRSFDVELTHVVLLGRLVGERHALQSRTHSSWCYGQRFALIDVSCIFLTVLCFGFVDRQDCRQEESRSFDAVRRVNRHQSFVRLSPSDLRNRSSCARSLWLKAEQERQHNYLKDGPYVSPEEVSAPPPPPPPRIVSIIHGPQCNNRNFDCCC